MRKTGGAGRKSNVYWNEGVRHLIVEKKEELSRYCRKRKGSCGRENKIAGEEESRIVRETVGC